MEKDINKIVQNLYLCSTDSREKMQQSIIENILYSLDLPLSQKELLDLIKTEFHFELDGFEINEIIKKMHNDGFLITSGNKFNLTEKSKQEILKNVLANNDIENKRNNRTKILIDSINGGLNDDEIKEIITLFNEYLYECFLEFGRTAIKYFLPFSADDNQSVNILKQKISKLTNQKQKKIFTTLVSIYPEKLNSDELNYLEKLAIKAEYFFSLGIPEETFNKSQDFKLNGLVILVDTNFIYSILGLHSHRQNDNCNQITKLITDNKIDCRLVYIRKTLEELNNKRNDFDRTITYETLTYNQIKSLLDSDKLNNFSREYFEKKIQDPETPHPSDKIIYGQKILTSKKIQIFNYSFPHLEDNKYLNAKFEDYYDFLNIKNEARVKYGLPEIIQKEDKILEHDIYLREAVIHLRKKKDKVNHLNYLCLTLDSGLIDFDRFASRRNLKGREDIVPNFILPSIFLRKIRPFIPLITDDYKKAFITSITTNTIDTSLPQYSEAVQRSMTYFKKLGIDDYDLIISIIKQELFFKEFIASEKEDRQEEFIRSEIDKAFEQLKKEKEKANADLLLSEMRRKQDVENEKRKISSLKESIESSSIAFEHEKGKLSNEIEKTKLEKEQIEFQKSNEKIKLEENILNEKKIAITEMNNQKYPIEKLAEKSMTSYKFWFCLIIFSYILCLTTLTVYFGWNKMEPFTYFFGAIGIVATYLYPAISGKDINPTKHFYDIHKELVIKKYKEFSFNIERFENISEEIEKLEIEINELKSAHTSRYGTYPEKYAP